MDCIQDIEPMSILAFDVNVPNKKIGAYARAGHIVACCARPSETDESFLSRANSLGCNVVFSQDADIGNIIQKEGYDMVWKRMA